MDEIEHGPLAQISPGALNLRLTRSTIKMQHSASWRIDKINPVHDLLIGLEGRGEYLIGGERLHLEPGEAIWIPPGTRFVGWNEGQAAFTGIAQHFTLEIFGSTDLLAQLELRQKVRLSKWEMLEPLARHYRQSAPPSSVTLAQHHGFMVLLLAYIDDAFVDWRGASAFQAQGANAIDIAVTVAASRIAAHPLEEGMAENVVAEAPFNPDYFLRAFQKRIGRTPRKFQDFKRMERAMPLLEAGQAVAQVGEAVGYADPYYFSRMFKRVIGLSPRAYVQRVRQSRDGALMQLDEAEQLDALRAVGLGPVS
ncbi:helix-turn-helix domain-containing protein [Neogemmobacter tilapiae]|uniref:AraC family transcriptional regulator n=1 Tax=Neogemmobacter tilapiae TaxID=875041 RepID=A0A918TH58_9RHOB|nr:AraC family transcriptional regulator [Gemmobacter tilapiae]GHC45885.1 AraC family transcriptional regulator [Gemmobacter tilapiae]